MSGTKATRAMKIVEVSGTHFEMGLQYGAACPEIKQTVETISELLETDLQKLKAFCASYMPVIQGYDPNLLDEIKGIAGAPKSTSKR